MYTSRSVYEAHTVGRLEFSTVALFYVSGLLVWYTDSDVVLLPEVIGAYRCKQKATLQS